MIDIASFKGELGGLVALAFGSGCVASFGYSWAFFVLPAKKALQTALQACIAERESADRRLEKQQERHDKEMIVERAECAERINKLEGRVRELENFFTVQSMGTVRQLGQMRRSSERVLDKLTDDDKAAVKKLDEESDDEQ